MLPLYDRLKMDRRVLAAAVSLAAGINFLPWTGPMIRASASLHLPISALFNPLIPVQIVGLVWVFGMSWMLGRREERRLGLGPRLAGADVPVLARHELTARRKDVAPSSQLLVQRIADDSGAWDDGCHG